MYEIHPSSWPVAVDANDPRDQFHRTAIHEARVATERRQPELAAPTPGLVGRLRLALAIGPVVATEPCSCPA